MTQGNLVVLAAPRLPELCRQMCEHAGIPVQYGQTTAERFIVRSYQEDPDLLAKLLEEAFVEDEAEVVVFRRTDPLDLNGLVAGQIVVQEGYESSCPVAEDLWQAVRPNLSAEILFFAVERRDEGGKLLGVTWAALSGEPATPEAPLRAALLRKDY